MGKSFAEAMQRRDMEYANLFLRFIENYTKQIEVTGKNRSELRAETSELNKKL